MQWLNRSSLYCTFTGLIACLLLGSLLHAQVPVTLWTKVYGGTTHQVLFSIDQTADGGFIMSGTVNFMTDTSDYWLVRTNADGDTLWTRTYGGAGSDITQSGQLTLDGGYIMAGLGEMWLIKTDADGDTLWTRRTGGPEGSEAPWVEQTADSGYIITGNISGTFADVGLIKTNSLGETEWIKTYDRGGDEYGRSVQQTTDGGYIIVGDIWIDPQTDDTDIWLIKTNSNGDIEWNNIFTGSGKESSNMVLQTTDLGYVIFGVTTSYGAGDLDWYLIKTDVTGTQQWTKPYGAANEDDAGRMVQTTDGGYLLTGHADLTESGNKDFRLIKTDANGITLWTHSIDAGGFDVGIGIAVLSDGEYAITGATDSRVADNLDGWLVRLGDPFTADSLALVALYDSLDGANWPNPWTLANPISTWDRVTIYNERVTQLSFLNKNLSGSIPPSIVDLTAVWYLSFNGNPGLDSIPAFIGQMTNLYNLDLSFCALTTVPTELGNLENLEELRLNNNSLTGAFPVWLADLSNLTVLRIDNNQFTGPIPTAVTTLANLTTFWINNNRFNFADIEPLVQAGLPVTYAPQADVGTPLDTTAYLGQPFSIEFTTPGTANTYQWQKNNVNITGEIDPVLSFTAIAYTDSGSYDVTINNTIATALTLSSDDFYIRVVLPPIHFDSLALVALYNSTDGANWTNHRGWLSPDTALTDWRGVTVTDGRVTRVNLGSNNLVDSIPASIGNLTKLTSLVLNRNELTGAIPTSIGNLRDLYTLSLDNNQLTGEIPAGIGNLINLSRLSLHNNQLSGSIPGDIGNLDTLTFLSLSGNQLSGQIPATIGNLTDLQFLYLASNQLSDTIPSEIGNLTELIRLTLERNQLSGSIPASVSNLTKMTLLLLGNNQLTGTIPADIGNLRALGTLILTGNQLTGAIPSAIGNNTSLTSLGLADNQLTGPIPPEIGNLINLSELYLNTNQLSGAVPATIGNLAKLTWLSLQYNQLTSIPPDIGGLVNLTYLDLSENQLASLPAEIGQLPSLTTLELSFNRLDSLPDFSGDTSLASLQVYGNRLTFEDIEPLIGLSIPSLSYGMQDSVGVAIDTTVDLGAELVFSVDVGGTANKYQWYKYAMVFAGDTSAIYTISSMSYQDTGTYVCQITNTIATELYLYSRPVHIAVSGTQAVSENEGIPAEYALHPAYPNPFNPSTTVRFDLPEATEVHLVVYDILGREVVRLVNERLEPGYRQVTWNGRTANGGEVPTGIYIARLVTAQYTRSIKMVLLK